MLLFQAVVTKFVGSDGQTYTTTQPPEIDDLSHLE